MHWLDNLKFLGIFYIYIGHLGAAAGKIYPFVFTFHVPLFFFISGLLFKKCVSVNDFLGVAKTSFKRIIIPYIVFSAIGITVYAVKSTLSTSVIIDMIINAFYGIRNQVPITSLWFLPCLFVVIIYHSALQYVFKSKWVVFFVSFVLYQLKPYWGASMPSVIFNVDSALYYLSFYSFGAALSSSIIKDWISIESYNKKLICSIVIFSLALFYYSYQYGAYTLINWISSYQIKSALLFIITCALFIPSIALSCILNIDALRCLGRNSLVLCGTEQILKVMVPTILLAFGIKIQIKDPLQAVLYTAILMAISYFTIVKIYNSFSLSRRAKLAADANEKINSSSA
ncbi:acyltransferase family protein [Pantoea sp. BIGb0393]|nr:acyltransferase family protein [Pantoea nemavictus]